jgi:GntR family transcriptional regulator, rspAB operon transcriptional repressor
MPATRSRVVTRDGQNVALVHQRLRDAILTGEIAAGHVTSQVALGQLLSVGRTPIREALRLLQREGLVVSEPNRRVRIAQLSGTDAEELYLMRIALETIAIRLTVPTLESQDLAELEGLMAQMEHYIRSKDGHGLRAPHRAFHTKLVAASGERVVTEITQLFDHAERYRLSQGGGKGGTQWMVRQDEHRAILDAAAAGDADLAARRLAEHYAHTARLVFAGLDPEHDLARLRTALAAAAPGSEAVLR